ncbi:hypothetical protein L6164_026712 [Bauhinia variegata]|uniref:Uncharacterized protein n=1 Tax=Bauhinia variegata TaxID=167791 RepID=A0ACB9LQM2_BAUVA|nr:hypothetical protein L6164_026712 [Bauhinia variegata]
MFASTILTPSTLKVSQFVGHIPKPHLGTLPNGSRKSPRSRVAVFSRVVHRQNRSFSPISHTKPAVVARVSSGGDTSADYTAQQSSPPDIEDVTSSSPGIGEGYVALFARMLGLDHEPPDREQAIITLWKYSLGGKKCSDAIMQFPSCINLTVNLLRSDSSSACEAAAGLLRSLSSVNLYRNSVADSGAIEEINGLLRRPSLAPEVKEQSMSALWNLSVDEKIRVKLANEDIILLIIKYLDDEDIKVKEAAGGVLANLALSHVNHKMMVELGVIPKLARFLSSDAEGSTITRKEARNALLELVKDEYYRILVIEEGLVPVPLVGSAAFKSLSPGLHAWPTLPDGTELERTSKEPSRFGASELLLGLNIDEKNANIEESKINAIIGRTQQKFLARIGAIEVEGQKIPDSECSNNQGITLLPWMDGVARLVLILELENKSAISRAAESIADASINEDMRIAFKEAGAIKHLVRLLNHNDDAVRLAVTRALERLSISHVICQSIEAEGVLGPLVDIVNHSQISENVVEKSLHILARILDPSKEMILKFYDGSVNGSKKTLNGAKDNAVPVGLIGTKQAISKGINSSGRNDVLDSTFIARIVEILKFSSSSLQAKAASVLEFVILTDPTMVSLISVNIESGLDAVFQQKILRSSDEESDLDYLPPEKYAIAVEEAGLAISATSRLMTKLLDSEQFRQTINLPHFTGLLRQILKSNIPLHSKDWIAACLIKLTSFSGYNLDFDPINVEVTLYETIPRLIEQIKFSFSPETQEAAVVELNRIIYEGVVDSTRAIASKGAIYPLVKLIEEGSGRAVEASLAILYNLSMDSENHSAILAAGAVPALRRIVLSQRPQWERALHLLRSLPT